jgi:hypothetical protein
MSSLSTAQYRQVEVPLYDGWGRAGAPLGDGARDTARLLDPEAAATFRPMAAPIQVADTKVGRGFIACQPDEHRALRRPPSPKRSREATG